MKNTENRKNRSTLTKRMGWYSALAAVMLLVLAACGTAGTTGSATGNNTGQVTTATAAAPEATSTIETAAATEPEATPTTGDTDDAGDVDHADDMDDMNDSVTAVPTGTTAVAAETATPAADAGAVAGASAEVQATLREWAIDLSVQEVAAGKVTIVVNNEGQFAHNLAVTDGSGTLAKTSTFRGSEGPQTLEVELQPGTYTLLCDLPGHAGRGQSTTLVVK